MSKEKEKYTDLIKQLIPINELSPQSQSEIIEKADISQLKKKKFLFKQGERDDYSYYLLEGVIDLLANNQLHNTITGGTDRARYAMAQLQPRQFSAQGKTECFLLKINRNDLDKVMVMSEKKHDGMTNGSSDVGVSELEVSDIESEDDIDWMTRMLQSELFARIPMANMHHVFAILEPVEFSKNDVVVKQGDPGDHYYIIAEGRCTVSRKPKEGSDDIKLAELVPGDSFGEEALIMDTTRNATITMDTNGILMRLSKDDFNKLIKEPTLNSVRFDQAQDLVHKGAQWLDVRYSNEYSQSHIKGSINIPMNLLRMQAEKISKDKEYIVYCDTGGRSSTAAFLLVERGYNVNYLKGGLISNPNAALVSSAEKPAEEKSGEKAKPAAPEKKEAIQEKVAEGPDKKAEIPASQASQEKLPDEAIEQKSLPAEKKPETTAAQRATEEKMDPDVRASVIEAELERTNMKLQDAEKIRKEVVAAEKKKQGDIVKELEKERKQLEQQKKNIQKEAEKIRQEEEKKIKKLKMESEKHLMEEKKKLEQIYSKNTSEMENIQKMKQELEEKERLAREKLEQESNVAKKMKQEAEELARTEKEKLEKESLEAKRMLEEAMRMKEEIQAAKKAIQEEGEVSRKEHERKEKELQEKVKNKLEAERRKFADQLAKNNMDLEQAKKDKAMAEAGRKAAHEEAKKIIDEFKQEHEKTIRIEEEKLKQEREKLEQESNQLKQQLSSIQHDKQKAEQEKLEAQKQIAMLKIKSVQNKDKDEEIRQTISDQIKEVQDKISVADKQIEEVQSAEKQAAEAVQLNEEDLRKQAEEEEKLKQQLEEDLQDFIEEHEEQVKKVSDKFSGTDYMKRIKERAEAARKDAEDATESLFADVASMLDDD